MPDAAPAVPDLASTLVRLAHALESIADRDRAPEPEALAAKHAAAMLGLSISKFRQLDRDGLIPVPVTLGTSNCPRWLTRELRAWLSSGAPPRIEWARTRHSAMKK